ncbi:MAG: acetate--CoA ligase family protein [Burkholderiales bacterium]|nr:acetate--CoA ligase family protein [Burkholderiales bacterium]
MAIIGASSDPEKLGGRPLAMSLQAGFPGRIYPINSRVPVVQGVQAYASLVDVGERVDCAILAVPATSIAQELEAAARAGADVAVIFASSFAETGAAGRQQQQRLADIGREHGIRILGPNCMGAFDVRSRFYASFLQAFDHYDGKGWPEPGAVAIVSQSGAIGAHLFVMLRDRGIGLSRFVTTGNQCDIDVAECIAYLAEDEDTRVIVVYLEGARQREPLEQALLLARARGKPVVMLKVGSSATGAGAIASHTASLAGSDAAYEALLSQCGAYRAASLADLVDVAAACHVGRYPADHRVGVISLSGGGGVVLADACERAGFVLPPLPESAQQRMREVVPFCAPRNPVDPGAPAMTDPAVTLKFLQIAFESGAPSGAAAPSTWLVFLTHLGHVPRMLEPLREGLIALRRRDPTRIVALILLGPESVGAQLRRDGFLVFGDPLDAVRTLAALCRIGAMLGTPAPERPRLALLRLPGLEKPSAELRAGPSELQARTLLRQAGLPVAPERLVLSAAQAADAAHGFGGRVALKLVAPQLAHKSDIGGVMLGVEPDAAAAAHNELLRRWQASGTPGAPEGVLVSPMIEHGIETILGVQVDPVLGPLLMFGLGGIDAELRPDVVFRLAPVERREALAMIRELRSYPLLDGARGRPRADLDTLADALVRLSELAAAHADRIAAIDVNPFIALPQGGCAVDAWMVLQPEEPVTPLAKETP